MNLRHSPAERTSISEDSLKRKTKEILERMINLYNRFQSEIDLMYDTQVVIWKLAFNLLSFDIAL